MSFVLMCVVCFCGAFTLMNILSYQSVEISESFRKIYWDEQQETNLLDANLNVHIQIKERVGNEIINIPYDEDSKRYFRVVYTMDEMNSTYINNTFFAEAGPCNSTNNITICPNEIDLEKAKLFANSDYRTSKRFNVKINRCTGYSNC